jgi:hypothetical protein
LQIGREGMMDEEEGWVSEGTELEEYVEQWVWLFGFRRWK